MKQDAKWIYVNNQDNTVRYVLGTKGQKPIFCFGINPSTASPDKLDPTMKKVEGIAKRNGYDSFIMFNVYPKRDTIFEDLEQCINDAEHIKNIQVIAETISEYNELNIWVAFGNHIYDRDYLPLCFMDIYKSLPKENIKWLATGVNKSGAPKHPLYQKKTSALIDFDMASYIKTLKKQYNEGKL